MTEDRRASAGFSYVVHLGAGIGRDLDDYLEAGAEMVILVEPDPDSVELLKARSEADPRLRVIAGAVSERSDHNRLIRFNFSDLNSLHKPTGLKDLYPGLDVEGDEPVTLYRAVELLRDLAPAPAGESMLVLETPGEELAILEALASEELLKGFSEIRVQVGQEPLYEGSTGLKEIRERLAAFGFDRDPSLDRSDPDLPRLRVRFNPDRLEILRLTTALEEMRVQIESAAMRQKELEAERDDLLADRNRVARERNEARTSLSALAEREKEASDAREAQLYKLEQTREDMLKAEGQIDFLRELFLGEDGL